jgi:hypothetical protein
LLSMAAAIGVSAIIASKNGGFISFAPMIIWFIIGQIFVVPRLRKKK